MTALPGPGIVNLRGLSVNFLPQIDCPDSEGLSNKDEFVIIFSSAGTNRSSMIFDRGMVHEALQQPFNLIFEVPMLV